MPSGHECPISPLPYRQEKHRCLSGDDLRDGLLGIIKNIVAPTVLTLTTGAEVSTVKFALWWWCFLPDR